MKLKQNVSESAQTEDKYNYDFGSMAQIISTSLVEIHISINFVDLLHRDSSANSNFRK